MAGLIGALRVTLSADTANFSSGMSKAQREAARTSSGIQKSLGNVKGALAGATSGLATGLATGALVAITKRALDYASSLGEVASQLGVTTRELQTYRYIASQVGISQEEMDKGLARLTLTLGKAAAGSKQAQTGFDALGVSIKNADGSTKTAGQILPELADKFSRINDTTKQAALAFTLFGKAGQNMTRLLQGGSAQINQLSDAAERMGIILSDEQIQKADDTADKLSALKQVLEARIAGTVADNAESILSLATALGTLTARIINFLSSNPEKALALLGALAGSRFGVPGAAVGGVIGYITGANAKQASADSNSNLRHRINEVKRAKGELQARKKAAADSGSIVSVRRGTSNLRSGGTIESAEAELRHQMALLRAAMGGAAKPVVGPPPGGFLETGDFLAGGGGGGPKAGRGKSAEQLAAEAERQRKDALRDAHDLDSELRDAKSRELEAQMDLATDTGTRAALSLKLLDLEDEQSRADLALAVGLGDMKESQAQEIQLSNDRVSLNKRQLIAQEEERRKREDGLRVQEAYADTEAELLAGQARLAETAGERREIELRILALAQRQERARLQAVLDDEHASATDKTIASQRMGKLDSLYALGAAGVRKDTAAPLEDYLDKLPDGLAEVNEALESVAANGLSSVVDGFADVIMGAESFGEMFSSIAEEVIRQLIRIAIQQVIVSTLMSAIGGGGGGGFGSVLSSFSGLLGGGGSEPANVLGMARGGSFTVAGNRGVDTNLLSINNVPVANVSYGERVGVTPANDTGGGSVVRIVPSEYFDAVVDGRAATVVKRAAPMIATAAQQNTMKSLRRARV